LLRHKQYCSARVAVQQLLLVSSVVFFRGFRLVFFWSCGFFLRLVGCLFLGLLQLKFACFLGLFFEISVLQIAFFSNFVAVLLFQVTAKGILGLFL